MFQLFMQRGDIVYLTLGKIHFLAKKNFSHSPAISNHLSSKFGVACSNAFGAGKSFVSKENEIFRINPLLRCISERSR